MGVAFEKLNDSNRAKEYWENAATGLSEPAAAIFYNDQQPDKIFYQGLALLKLNRKAEADLRFEKLVNYAKEHINDHVSIDYFAVSLPDLTIWEDDLDKRNKIHCLYMQGLGYLGLKQIDKAAESFDEVLAIEKGHLGVVVHQKLLETTNVG